jgi:hypothetical protein
MDTHASALPEVQSLPPFASRLFAEIFEYTYQANPYATQKHYPIEAADLTPVSALSEQRDGAPAGSLAEQANQIVSREMLASAIESSGRAIFLEIAERSEHF